MVMLCKFLGFLFGRFVWTLFTTIYLDNVIQFLWCETKSQNVIKSLHVLTNILTL